MIIGGGSAEQLKKQQKMNYMYVAVETNTRSHSGVLAELFPVCHWNLKKNFSRGGRKTKENEYDARGEVCGDARGSGVVLAGSTRHSFAIIVCASLHFSNVLHFHFSSA